MFVSFTLLLILNFAHGLVLDPVADSCVQALEYPYLVTCTNPRWVPGGNPIDVCLGFNGVNNILCGTIWGSCTVWCSASGRGPCVKASNANGFPTQYVEGQTTTRGTQITSLSCLPSLAPVNKRFGRANFPPSDGSVVANCTQQPDRLSVLCTDVSFAASSSVSPRPRMDHCFRAGSTFCDTPFVALVCMLLGYGGAKGYTLATTSASQYFDLALCPGCHAFATISCFTQVYSTHTRSVSMSSTDVSTVSHSQGNFTDTVQPSPSGSLTRSSTRGSPSVTPSANESFSLSRHRVSETGNFTPSTSDSASRSDSAPVQRPLTTSAFVSSATGVDQGTATQLLVAGNVGTAVAGAVSTSAGSKQASLSQLVTSASCMSLSEVADSFPVPDAGSLLPALPALFVPDEGDVTGASDAAAVLVTNLIAVLLLFVVNVTYGATSRAVRSTFENVVTSTYSIAVSFLGPTMFGAAVTLLRYPFTLPTNTRVVGAVTVLAVLGVLAATFAACRVPIVRKVGLGVPDVAVGFRERLQYHWALFYDAARDGEASHVRLLVFEDLGVAYVIALLSSLYPGRQAVCVGLGVAVVVVALAHVVYLAAVRPYRERLKAVLAFANGVIVAAVAVLAQVTLSQPGATSNFDSPVVFALAAAMVAANCFFFVQTFVLGVHGLYEAVMRPAAPPSEALRRKGHDDEAFAVVEEEPINLDALGIEETMVPLTASHGRLLPASPASSSLVPQSPATNPLLAVRHDDL